MKLSGGIPRQNGLGINPLVSLATSLVPAVVGAKTGGGGGSGGPGGGMPAMTTINPNFQQQFNPQFSPVMQQQQDSPGATQSGAPSQYTAGGQTAPGSGIPANQPYSFPQPFPASQPVIQSNDQTAQLIKWVVIGGLILLAFKALQSPQGKKAVKTARKKLRGKKGQGNSE